MDRTRVYAREKFEYDQKMIIQAKSGNKCCHCGAEKYPGFGATVDHFIPLNKGGSNDLKNLIMLCEDCNLEKGEDIVEPEEYLKYLKEPYKQEVIDYFNSYITSHDFFSRGNLLACDRYYFSFYDTRLWHPKFSRKGKVPLQNNIAMKLILKRASEDVLPSLITYTQAYFKKYDIPWGFTEAKKYIEFCFKFGCIYYTKKNKEINSVFPVLLYNFYEEGSYISDNTFDKHLCIIPMVYYATSASGISTAYHIIGYIPEVIADEQNLQFVPAMIDTFANDKLLPTIDQYCCGGRHSGFIKGYLGGVMAKHAYMSDEYRNGTEEERIKIRKKTAGVFNKLPDRRDEAQKFVQRNKEAEWLLNYIGKFPMKYSTCEAQHLAMERMRIEDAKERNNTKRDNVDS